MFIDANIFVHTVIHSDRRAALCAKFLEKVESGQITGYTSLMVIDEVAWVLMRERTAEVAVQAWNKILRMPRLEILPLDEEVAVKSPYFIERYGLEPHDAIHAATCTANGIKNIVSFDKVFDKVSELERKTPFDF
ncbi:PIN domain-containing protein [archaeon]|nr:PIN domain-containing protein [archaeon]